jgi:hypothetical protein
MVTFLSPLFLIGLLSAAIPLLVHLSRSRRTKTMTFSTTRFFTDQFLRSYRMSRLQEIVLLLFRMALCALLAMALARPIWMPKGRSLVPTGRRAVVIVLDNSASMAYQEDGVTLFDRAKNAAKEILRGLRQSDLAGLVLAGRREAGPDAQFARPTPQQADVVRAIEGLHVTALGTDLTAAVEMARGQLRSTQAANKEIYVLSDLQETAWPEGGPTGRDEGDVEVTLVRIAPRAASNLAVTAVQYAVGRPLAGVPFALRPHIVAQGAPARTAEVRLFLDGRKVAQRPLEWLQGGRWAVPRFHATFASGGWHSGYVEVSGDALPLDDRRYFAFDVLEHVKVLAVDGAPSQVPHFDEVFFLKMALAGVPQSRGPFDVDVVSPQALPEAKLDGYQVVILANVDKLAGPVRTVLEQFVDRGGGLLVFLGDLVDASAYNADLLGANQLHGGLLPARLGKVVGDPTGAEAFAQIGRVESDHPLLAAFLEPGFADLGRVRLRAFWTLEPGETPVLMRASNGSPLLCEKPFGKGRVLVCAAPCDRDWTDFPINPGYLPWLHTLVGGLAENRAVMQTSPLTGDSIGVPIAVTEDLPRVLVTRPDGSFGSAEAGTDPAKPLVFRDTTQAGVYTFTPAKDSAKGRLVAVNLEGYESDLTFRSVRLPFGPQWTLVVDPARLADVAQGSRRTARLWDWALYAALIVALAEPWLANRISAKHYGAPRMST